MAIYHCSVKPMGRSSGRSAVAAAAYRSGEVLTNERDGITHDYRARSGVIDSDIILPKGIDAEWAQDRSTLWNRAEHAESRKDSRTSREVVLALPHELEMEDRIEAARKFARHLANRYGVAVDIAIHNPTPGGKEQNCHAHLMMTTRAVVSDGFADRKAELERQNKALLAENRPTTDIQLREIRKVWETVANDALIRAGREERIDHRSHADRGLELEPTKHVGVHATQMERRGLSVSRQRIDAEAAARNAETIREEPEQILKLIEGEKSVFTKQDIARALHRYVNDDPHEFQSALARVVASSELVEIAPEGKDDRGREQPARYSTAGMIKIERGVVNGAERLTSDTSHEVDWRHVTRATNEVNAKIRRGGSYGLSYEQMVAIKRITGKERFSSIIGFAGAGKSTALEAARLAWEAQGYRVRGAALAGKAADGLRSSAGIESRTLASWEASWKRDRDTLTSKDVFVIDEAAMLSSRQVARIVSEVEARGAKVVMVGDYEQLQAIGAGAAFRSIVEKTGAAELTEIRRQRRPWQGQASVAFARTDTAAGLKAYGDAGRIHMDTTKDEAKARLVESYLKHRAGKPDASRIVLAHRRVDVADLNRQLRTALVERGEVAAEGATFETRDGRREFAPGDRIVFGENNRDLGVMNGSLATVEAIKDGRIIARLDGEDRRVSVSVAEYDAIDHGYATTIHKSQGATVDKAFVLPSATMDRHLTYVAMTRHRDDVEMFASREDFAGRAGRLVEHGHAPFEHDASKGQSYFVTIEDEAGARRTVWGADLERAVSESGAAIGDEIALSHKGSRTVEINGVEHQRNTWEVETGDEIARREMSRRLSRDGSKETTLDYEPQPAVSIADRMGIVSEIELPKPEQPRPPNDRGKQLWYREEIMNHFAPDYRETIGKRYGWLEDAERQGLQRYVSEQTGREDWLRLDSFDMQKLYERVSGEQAPQPAKEQKQSDWRDKYPTAQPDPDAAKREALKADIRSHYETEFRKQADIGDRRLTARENHQLDELIGKHVGDPNWTKGSLQDLRDLRDNVSEDRSTLERPQPEAPDWKVAHQADRSSPSLETAQQRMEETVRRAREQREAMKNRGPGNER